MSTHLYPLLLFCCLLCACNQQITLPPAPVPAPASPSSILDKTKGMTAYPGYFPYWWDEKEGKIWLEISRFDSTFLYVSALPAGVGSNDIGLDRGQLGGQRVVKFVRSGNKILLVQLNMAYRASSENPAERRSVEEAFAQSVLFGFTVAFQEKGRCLVDFTPFLLQDAHDVAGTLAKTNQGTYTLDPGRSAIYLEWTKNFPQNSEWEATTTFTGRATGDFIRSVTPTPNVVTVRQHHSFIQLPDADYTPRQFDPRSGFFETSWFDYSVPIGAPIAQRYILRHRLKKKDPSAAISDPVEPIVYYMDPGAPEPIKTALIEGGRWWNQAFEAAGYRNAFIIKELPADADPMDVRYNLVQWVHRSTRGWSYGSTVSDPRTGEIIKGHVSLGSLRVRQDYLIAQGLRSPFDGMESIDSVSENMALARLRQLSAHEIGHTLGLAHNFASSMNDRASVMDYPHPNLQLKADGSLDFSNAYDDKIGAFDKRSILYGYQDFPAGTDEKAALNTILEENIRLGLLHISDEGARSPATANPQASLWDNGPDAPAELRRLIQVRASALQHFGEKSIPQGRVMADLERVLAPLYLAHRYQVEATAKLLGGVRYAYSVRGDGQLNNVPVAESAQEDAFNTLMETLQPAFLSLPETIIRQIPPQPIGYNRDPEMFKSSTGGFFDPLAAAASSAGLTLDVLLMPERLNRMVEQSARGALPEFNLPEMLRKLHTRLLLPQSTDTRMQAEIRRMVRQGYLNRLLGVMASDMSSSAVKGFVLLELNEMEKGFMVQRNQTADVNEQASLGYLLEQLKRYREKPGEFKAAPGLPAPPGMPIGCED